MNYEYQKSDISQIKAVIDPFPLTFISPENLSIQIEFSVSIHLSNSFLQEEYHSFQEVKSCMYDTLKQIRQGGSNLANYEITQIHFWKDKHLKFYINISYAPTFLPSAINLVSSLMTQTNAGYSTHSPR